MADVFAALGDATRRSILETVSARGSATTTELASELPITRQAVAKHLAVLADAGLVTGERVGRETRFTPGRAEVLGDAIGWMAGVGAGWDTRLAALARAAQRRASPRGRAPRAGS